MEQEIRNKIKAFMSRNKITSNKLARLARVEPASLHRFLKEDRSISLQTAEKLMRVIEERP
jgi:plasmid maintenance system antidote protein VapI